MKYTPFHLALHAAIVTFGLTSISAWSQTLPPAGQVGKETIPSVPPREASPIAVPALPAPGAAGSSAVSISVTAFTFTGNTAISSEELQAVVAPSLNQKLDFAGLDKVADSVSRHYRKQGYTVARAYLPPQQSADGIIQIAIIEGRIGAVNLTNGSEVNSELLRLVLANNLCDVEDGKDCVGKLVQDSGVERAVLLARDLPGVSAIASLKPGQVVGTSDLDVATKLTKARAYSLGIDNYGSPATGTIRLNASADFNNLGNGGDQLSLGIATTDMAGTTTGSAGYSVPVGYRGQRVGIAFARSQYRLGGDYKNTLSHGTSNALSAYTTYPIIRGVNQSLYARASVEVRGAVSSVDSLNGVLNEQSSFKSNANVARLGLNGDNVDSLGGGGYTVYGLTFSQGYIGTNDPNVAKTVRSAARFGKFSYNLARQQALTGPVTLYAAINGQAGNKNLDGSEQTGLGGPSSARGYGGEAGGSTGANGTIELRYTTPIQIADELPNLTYGLFWDRGWVQYYQTPLNTTDANTRSLSSYGLTLTLQSQAKVPTPTSMGYFLRAMIGAHSMAAGQTSNVDPRSKGKFWLQGGLTF